MLYVPVCGWVCVKLLLVDRLFRWLFWCAVVCVCYKCLNSGFVVNSVVIVTFIVVFIVGLVFVFVVRLLLAWVWV